MNWKYIRIFLIIFIGLLGPFFARGLDKKSSMEWPDSLLIGGMFFAFCFGAYFFHYKKRGSDLPWPSPSWERNPFLYFQYPLDFFQQTGWNAYAFGLTATMYASATDVAKLPTTCLFLLMGISISLSMKIWMFLMPHSVQS